MLRRRYRDQVWVDNLACHLEYDPYTHTLFLFRYPSFCLAHVECNKSTLYACTAPALGIGWATTTDLNQMLRETLLSYRLLFGQHKAARQVFRKSKPFHDVDAGLRDSFLKSLCVQPNCPEELNVAVRDAYNLH